MGGTLGYMGILYWILGGFFVLVFFILVLWTIWLFQEWQLLETILEEFQYQENFISISNKKYIVNYFFTSKKLISHEYNLLEVGTSSPRL